MNLETLKNLYRTHREPSLYGRYIFADHIVPLLEIHKKYFTIETIGTSVLGELIYALTIGNGPRKILMWSQMHGNESTTTKAIFDLCNVFAHDSSEYNIKTVLDNCTIAIIPMLNPDGGKLYTRVNANGIDLNRDAQERTQPESVALRRFFDTFKPDFCFNLHGQRTIFGAGSTRHPATLSFLAPAQDQACTLTDTRKKAMEVIVKMNENLQNQIPNQVGIYDDTFNINCVGDTFQSLNVPTVLFEAGHYAADYEREFVREYIFQSLLVAIAYIATDLVTGKDYELYFKIPQNEKIFYDIIIRNTRSLNNKYDIAIQYKERLKDKKVEFVPVVEKIEESIAFFGHKEVDALGSTVLTINKEDIFVGYENDFVLINNELFSLKP